MARKPHRPSSQIQRRTLLIDGMRLRSWGLVGYVTSNRGWSYSPCRHLLTGRVALGQELTRIAIPWGILRPGLGVFAIPAAATPKGERTPVAQAAPLKMVVARASTATALRGEVTTLAWSVIREARVMQRAPKRSDSQNHPPPHLPGELSFIYFRCNAGL